LLPAPHKPCIATLVMLSKICNRTAKNAPCFAPSGRVSGLCLKGALLATASIRSATPTKFYCRAVMWHSKTKKRIISILDNLS
jgi:hypothetical protein